MRATLPLVMALALTACADSPAEPVAPADVRIVSASTRSIMDAEQLTLTLKNDGGPGGFKLRVETMSNVPNGPRPVTESEDMPVVAGWSETLTFDITGGCCRITRVDVSTRSQGSLQYRETATHNF